MSEGQMEPTPYRVLARKYRPQTFSDLFGQEALVRTLTNAIRTGRIAHGFLLTGVRGVGKTTTARIIARGLNCVGADGAGGPTPDPCGVCDPCRAIAADRHVDVMEMDAASRTGVEDIREITDGVRYKPVSARFKIYIIDEVHMLSKNAFNALLKTLEEPPEHTKFVFATTELRKVPLTVLSRCQRFDLRRIEPPVLIQLFERVCKAEGVDLSPEAAVLIARAADGSARDGLSLLDQAMALSPGRIEEAPVRDMLGLADRALLVDLLENLLAGRIADALAIASNLAARGAEPLVTAQDLLELVHAVTKLKLVPTDEAVGLLAGAERARGLDLAGRLSVPHLSRAWQALLKGIGEIQQAPDSQAALEMVLIRLAHMSDLPTPAELIRQLGDGAAASAAARSAPAPRPTPVVSGGGGALRAAQALPAAVAEPVAAEAAAGLPMPQSFAELVELFGQRKEPILRAHLVADTHLVHFEPGRLEFRPSSNAPRDLATQVAERLQQWTGRRWLVSLATSGGAATLREQESESLKARRALATSHPLVLAVLDTFPGARIGEVRDLGGEPPPPAATAADPEPAPVEDGADDDRDDWDEMLDL